MRTDSRFSGVSAEYLIKNTRRRARFYATAAVLHRDYLSVDMLCHDIAIAERDVVLRRFPILHRTGRVRMFAPLTNRSLSFITLACVTVIMLP